MRDNAPNSRRNLDIAINKLTVTTSNPVALIPVHHQIAQKLHALSAENNA